MVSAVRQKSTRAAAKRLFELTELLSLDSEPEFHDAHDGEAAQESQGSSDEDPGLESEVDDRPVRKNANKRARRNRSEESSAESPENGGNSLYRALSVVDVDVSDLALEWIETHGEDTLNDTSSAITDLFNLVLRCCGCVNVAQPHDMINSDSAPATVAELAVLFEKQRYHEYPFISTNKSIRFFRRNVADFFEALILVGHEKGALYVEEEDSDSTSLASPMMNDIVAWLTALSTSNVRPFRYVATSLLLVLQTTICQQSVSLIVALEKQQRQLNTARNNRSRNQRAQERKIEIISAAIDKFSREVDTLAEYSTDLFQNVFVRRYKDVDSAIRIECVKALGQWMTIHIETFLQAKYLRYLGWLLSDPNDNVREEVTRSLHKVYKYVTTRSDMLSLGLRKFTERFKRQLLNMLWGENHVSTKIQLIGIYHELLGLGFLGDGEINEIVLYGFYLAEVTSKQDKVKLEWSKLVCTVSDDKLRKELEKFSSFLADNISTIFGDESDQLDVQQCIKFRVLGDLLHDSYSHYIDQKRSNVTVLQMELDFHTLVTLTFSTIYSLPEFQGTWQFLIRYALCDVSSATFTPRDVSEDDYASSQGEELKDRLEINSVADRSVILCFVAGAFNHITLRKPSRRLDDAESQDNINVALPMVSQYLTELEKYLSKSPESYAVFMRFWNFIVVPLSRSVPDIYDNAGGSDTLDSIQERILEFYLDVEDFSQSLQNVFDRYFALLLKYFNSERLTERVNSDVMLSASITMKIEDLLTSLAAEVINAFNSQDLIEDFNDADDAMIPEDQKVLCNRLLKSSTAISKLSLMAKNININKYIADPILDNNNSLLEFVSTRFLTKIDFISLIELWPNNYLQILTPMQVACEALLDLLLMSMCWKLEDLVYASDDNTALLISIDLFLDDVEKSIDSLSKIITNVQVASKELNGKTSSSDKSMSQLVQRLIDLESILADHLIDAIVSVRVFYQRLRGGNSFKHFNRFFSNADGIGKFVEGTLPSELQSTFLHVFLVGEAQLARTLSVTLERGENEDVNYEDMNFATPVIVREPITREITEFGMSDDEEEDLVSARDPRIEAEAREKESNAISNSLQEQQIWAVEKKLLVYVVKLLSLVNTGGLSDEIVNRLDLNAEVLGDSYQRIVIDGRRPVSTGVSEAADSTASHLLLNEATE